MNKQYCKVLIISLISIVALAVGIALIIVASISLSNGVQNNNGNSKTTISIITSSTTQNFVSTTQQSLPTIPNVPYIPPASGIVFGIDSSDAVDPSTYNYLHNTLIESIISGNWTHPERVGALCYSKLGYHDNSSFGINSFDTIIKNIKQFSYFPGSSSLSVGLKLIREQFWHTLPQNDKYLQTILFTASSNSDDISDAMTDGMMLNQDGQLIIVGIGNNVDEKLLQKLTKNVLIWNYGVNDLRIIDNIRKLLYNFNPNIASTTVGTQTTTTKSQSNISISTIPTTQVQSTTTKITTTQVITTTQSPSPIPYVPCLTNIIITVDSSSDTLTNDQFKNQKLILKNNITTSWTHYERLSLVSYDTNVNTLFTFNTIKDHNDFDNKLDTIKQSSGSSLTRLLSGLLTLQTTNNQPLSIFVFISELNYADLQLSKAYATQLLEKGKLNFIILNNNVSPYDLNILNPSKIILYNFTDEGVNSLITFFNQSLSCNFIPSPSLPPTTMLPHTTTTIPSTTTQSSIYYPPKSSIIIGIDSSKNIDNDLYQNMLNAVTDKIITEQWNYPYRTGAFGYDNALNTETVQFGLSKYSDIRKLIKKFVKLDKSCSIATGMNDIGEQFYFLTPPDIVYMQTIILTTCSDMNDINDAIEEAFFLSSMGQLIIVGVGDKVNESNLRVLTDNVFIWDGVNMNSDVFHNIEKAIVNFNPNETTITTLKSEVKSTTIENPITSYYPCKSNIILALDASSDVISKDQFEKQISVLTESIIKDWNHYERVALSWYNSVPSTFFSFNSINSYEEFVSDIQLAHQSKGYSLAGVLASLADLETNNTFPMSTFVYISQVIDEDIEASREFAKKLLQKGSLNFIILTYNVTEVQLSKLLSLYPSRFWYWAFENSEVEELGQFFIGAMRCDNSRTTIQTRTPTTTVQQMTSTTTAQQRTSTTTQVTSTLPYYPCNSSIIFSIPNSNESLSTTQYNSLIKLLSSNRIIESYWNHFERLSTISFNTIPSVSVPFNTITNKDSFNIMISQLTQSANPNSLTSLLQFLSTYPTFSQPSNYFIFIGKTSLNDLEESKKYSKNISMQGSLNFIIIDNDIDPSSLNPYFYNNLFLWNSTSSNYSNDLGNFILNSILC
uniref:VWFA domain-containing protein n=1 Tax=Parastrongyloides trichosuri TaxID=131310 RepID=A0A0N4ZA65_PARTI